MHITLETDYAIRIVDLLAKNAGRDAACGSKLQPSGTPPLDAKSISEKTGVSHRYALKILRKLVAGGIVKSRRGVHGGYGLLKKPADISLYDVVEIMEGSYKFSRCLEENYNCSSAMSGCKCGYQAVFGDISELVIKELKKHKFG
ncbi:MAG: Rrf2 family transcriptional regulator [Oscillospiraceae bacterium]|nr:Rrf2 family transcriptional regulator [Oscillospiraceae bacterium]